jgi:hypothetical protein
MQGTIRNVCFATLCLLGSPAVAAPATPDRMAQTEPGQAHKPASTDELDRYAQRERSAEKLEKFEGGRGRYIEASTLIIVLLVVILVMIIL